jgi:hypothetical protein
MAEATLHEHQSRLLGVLTIKAAQRFSAETFFIEEDGGVRQMRMTCVGDVVLLDHPADATRPRSINCYLVKMLDFTAAGPAARTQSGSRSARIACCIHAMEAQRNASGSASAARGLAL